MNNVSLTASRYSPGYKIKTIFNNLFGYRYFRRMGCYGGCFLYAYIIEGNPYSVNDAKYYLNKKRGILDEIPETPENYARLRNIKYQIEDVEMFLDYVNTSPSVNERELIINEFNK